MHVTVKWFDGKYPSFNLNLHKAEGQTEFLSIKGCRIVSGSNGDFVSFPSTKKDDGKYWNHAWANEQFAEYVLKLANESKPQKSPEQRSAQGSTRSNDLHDDIPFAPRKYRFEV